MKNGVIDFCRVGCAGLVLLVAGLGFGGCASQQSYDQLKDANRTLTDRVAELQRANQELTNENSLLQKQRSANELAVSDLTRMNAELKRQLSDAGVNMTELERRLQGLAMGPLDEQTDRALAALASQYPDLIKYDSAKGMLRFASDLTFASGDDSVTDNAKQSLAALAKILNSGAAAAYEIVIVGHTDAQAISSRTAARHPTNVHLSAHRAISVRKEMAGMGVPPDKMMVAGWGEFRPLVPNTGPKGNTPPNRRVDVFLTRSTGSLGDTTEPTGGAAKPENAATPTRQPDMIK